ncbi:hypothetical protein HYR99_41075 [Candidatus Poribacteria bacterium]|nr:hypothetical protein [Candidatus Poribacteria bacterium]
MRSRFLDIIDARMEACYFNEAIAQQPKTSTAGFSVAPVNVAHLFDDSEAQDLTATVSETMQNTNE